MRFCRRLRRQIRFSNDRNILHAPFFSFFFTYCQMIIEPFPPFFCSFLLTEYILHLFHAYVTGVEKMLRTHSDRQNMLPSTFTLRCRFPQIKPSKILQIINISCRLANNHEDGISVFRNVIGG